MKRTPKNELILQENRSNSRKEIPTKFVCLFADLLFDMFALMHFLFCCSGEKASFVLFCVISAQRILGGGKNFVEMCKSTWIGVHRVKRKEERTYSICLGEFCSIKPLLPSQKNRKHSVTLEKMKTKDPAKAH